MMLYENGDIVLTSFPFTNLESTKKRPVLILSNIPFASKMNFILVAMITSNIEQTKIMGDILINDWQECGLLHPSLLRLSKLCTIESNIIVKKLGNLPTYNKKKVESELKHIFSAWIS